ncbi:MAG TPA: arginyltransferase [Pseudomonadales bacterium]|jgi:arginyl-tRNA--protein-N-Asp/Glu arginylyltransferase|nr:arginyltransferase [Pseudomonadales bacterium]HNH72060.1 arginyltransferase [Pseudomonadales bacterium]HNI65991.1 arginyltransferase [Pseudomonadales bacterium]HNJ74783.1 arginyltransferase [Pseudomonadales bacterium]HNN37478.1 arginyltransferase [Pseudomonadales bacterium]
MTSQTQIKLFSTLPHPCSYLPDEVATSLFVDPELPMTGRLYTVLSRMGFRRSGAHVYRPNCRSCSACLSIRIPVQRFAPDRQQRRVWKKNDDVTLQLVESIDSALHYDLYQRYICQRHADGDMFPPTPEQFHSFLATACDFTRFIELRIGEQLIAVAVADLLDDGLSAVYTFFDPDLEPRSLGVLAVLWQIEYCRQRGLPYLYLGYWIQNCRKMRYKLRYRPAELLIDQRWIQLN